MADYVFHPSATAEYLAIGAKFYAQSRARAARFERAVEDVIASITMWPQAWPRLDDTYRFCRVKGFPYLVVYRVDGDVAVIAELHHYGQQFGSWKGR
jgi:hypothetical protein